MNYKMHVKKKKTMKVADKNVAIHTEEGKKEHE